MNYKKELLKWVSLEIMNIGNDISNEEFDFMVGDMKLRLVEIIVDDNEEENKIKFITLSNTGVDNTIRIEYDINFLVDNIVEFDDFYNRLIRITDYYMEM